MTTPNGTSGCSNAKRRHTAESGLRACCREGCNRRQRREGFSTAQYRAWESLPVREQLIFQSAQWIFRLICRESGIDVPKTCRILRSARRDCFVFGARGRRSAGFAGFGFRDALGELETLAGLFPLFDVDALLLELGPVGFEVAALRFALEWHEDLPDRFDAVMEACAGVRVGRVSKVSWENSGDGIRCVPGGVNG